MPNAVATGELTIIAKAKDMASDVLDSIGDKIKSLASAGGSALGSILSLPFKVMGAAIMAPFRLIGSLWGLLKDLRTWMAGYFVQTIVQTFAEFEFGLKKVEALLQGRAIDFDQFRVNMEDVAMATAQNLDEVAKAARLAISSQKIPYEDLASFLTVAGKLATATGDKMLETTKGLVQVMSSWGLEAKHATAIADIFFAAMEQGHAEVSELVRTMGRVNQVAAEMGISFVIAVSAVAAITRSGVKANEAVTALRQMISSVMRSTDAAGEEFKKFGLTLDDMKRVGFVEWLRNLDKALKSGNTNAGNLWRNIRALFGAMALTGDHVKDLEAIIKRVENAGGSLERAFGLMSQTMLVKTRSAKIAIQSVFNEFVGVLEPMINAAADAIVELAVQAIAYMPIVQLIFEKVGATLQQVALLIRGAWERGTLWESVSVGLKFLGNQIILFFDLIFRMVGPIMAATGRSIGVALLNGFGSAVGEGLAKKLLEVQEATDQATGPVKKSLLAMQNSLLGLGTALTGQSREALISWAQTVRQMDKNIMITTTRLDGLKGMLTELEEKGPLDIGYNSAVVTSLKNQIAEVEKELEGMTSVRQKLQNDLGQIVGVGTADIGAAFEKLSATAVTAFGEFATKTKENAREAFNALDVESQNTIIRIGEVWDTLPEEMQAALPRIAEKIKALKEALPEIWKALGETRQEIAKQLSIWEDSAVKMIGGVSDAFVTFFDVLTQKGKKGADAFRAAGGIIVGVLKDIAKMLLQRALMMFLFHVVGQGSMTGGVTSGNKVVPGGGLFGFLGSILYPNGAPSENASGNANLGGGWNPIPGFAGGAKNINRATLGWVGEGPVPEAVVPLPNGQDIPVEMRGGGGMTIIVQNKINALDTQSFAMALSNQESTISKLVLKKAMEDGDYGRKLGIHVTKGVRS